MGLVCPEWAGRPAYRRQERTWWSGFGIPEKVLFLFRKDNECGQTSRTIQLNVKQFPLSCLSVVNEVALNSLITGLLTMNALNQLKSHFGKHFLLLFV